MPASPDENGKPVLTHGSSASSVASTPRPRPIRGIEELVEHPECIADSPTLPDVDNGRPWPDSPRAARVQHCELVRLLHINMERYQAIKYVNGPLQEFADEPNLVPKPLFYDPEDRQLFVRPLHERTPSRLEKLRRASQLDPSGSAEAVSHDQDLGSAELSTSAVGNTRSVGLRGGFVPLLSDDVYAPAQPDVLRPAIRGYSRRRPLSSPPKGFSRLSPVKEVSSIPRKPLRSPPRKDSPTKSTDSPTLPRKLLPSPARRSPKKFSVTPRRSLSTGAPILSPTRFRGSPYAVSQWASPPTPELPKRSESRGGGHDQPLSFRRGLLWDNFSPFQHESLDRAGTVSRLADSFSNVSIQKRPATDLDLRGDLSVPPAEEPRARIASKGSFNGMRELGLRPSSRSDGVVDFKKLNLGAYKDPQPERVSRTPKSMLKVPITDMVKEGWFKPNDMWIYARRVKAPKEEIYIYKEMPVLKVNKDGSIALAVPNGDLEKLPEKDVPESSARITRKPIPPPRGSTELSHVASPPPTYDSPRQFPPLPTGAYSLHRPVGAIPAIAPPSSPPAALRRLPPPAPMVSCTTDTSAFTIVETKLLHDLERRIFELDGRVSSSRGHEGGANVWHTIRCARDGEDRGSLWEMRQRCAAGWKQEAESESRNSEARTVLDKGRTYS